MDWPRAPAWVCAYLRNGVGCAQGNPRKFWARVRRWRNGVADRLLTRPKEKIWARVHRWLAGFVCADDELGGVLVCAYLRNGVADRLLTRPKEKIWARVHRWLAEWGC